MKTYIEKPRCNGSIKIKEKMFEYYTKWGENVKDVR